VFQLSYRQKSKREAASVGGLFPRQAPAFGAPCACASLPPSAVLSGANGVTAVIILIWLGHTRDFCAQVHAALRFADRCAMAKYNFLGPQTAKYILSRAGGMDVDFDALSRAQVSRLLIYADKYGYRNKQCSRVARAILACLSLASRAKGRSAGLVPSREDALIECRSAVDCRGIHLAVSGRQTPARGPARLRSSCLALLGLCS
jgi:hypothetical protein